jgi:hypothetical protein
MIAEGSTNEHRVLLRAPDPKIDQTVVIIVTRRAPVLP